MDFETYLASIGLGSGRGEAYEDAVAAARVNYDRLMSSGDYGTNIGGIVPGISKPGPVMIDGQQWARAGVSPDSLTEQRLSGMLRPEDYMHSDQYGDLVRSGTADTLNARAREISQQDKQGGLTNGIQGFFDKGGGVALLAAGLGGLAASGAGLAGAAEGTAGAGGLGITEIPEVYQAGSGFGVGDAAWGVNPVSGDAGGVFADMYSQYAPVTNPVGTPFADMYNAYAPTGPSWSLPPGASAATGAAQALSDDDFGMDYGGVPGETQLTPDQISRLLSGAGTAAKLASGAKSLTDLLTDPRTLLGAGSALGSALLQKSAIDSAVKAQTDSAKYATDATTAMYQQNRTDLAPWRDAGGGAVKRLSDMLTPGNQFTALQADPGYQFRMDEGQKALERSAAARGGLFSGNTGKAITQYGQNFASNEFGNATNRLANLAGLGQTSANSTALLGQNAATQAGSNAIGAGNARASGYVGGANAASGSLSSFLKNMQENELLDLLRNRGTAYG